MHICTVCVVVFFFSSLYQINANDKWWLNLMKTNKNPDNSVKEWKREVKCDANIRDLIWVCVFFMLYYVKWIRSSFKKWPRSGRTKRKRKTDKDQEKMWNDEPGAFMYWVLQTNLRRPLWLTVIWWPDGNTIKWLKETLIIKKHFISVNCLRKKAILTRA